MDKILKTLDRKKLLKFGSRLIDYVLLEIESTNQKLLSRISGEKEPTISGIVNENGTASDRTIRRCILKIMAHYKVEYSQIEDIFIGGENTLTTEKKTERTQFIADVEINHCEFISGYWLSRFDYIKNQDTGELGHQYDVEQLEISGEDDLEGLNLSGISAHGKVFFHRLKVQVVGDYLVGTWANFKDSKNIGTFLLYIDMNFCVMTGLHLGNSNGKTIQSGKWDWIKLEVDKQLDDNLFKTRTMDKVERLDANFNQWLKNRVPVALEEVLERKS